MMRQPRQHDEKHLRFIRGLPCVVCDDNTSTEAVHVRFACEGKRHVGLGEKPDDKWTVPLCGKCHRLQHEQNEQAWWQEQGMDPLKIASGLFKVTGDHGGGLLTIRACRRKPHWRACLASEVTGASCQLPECDC